MFQRGFKTWCENVALSIRAELKLAKSAPLAASQVAQNLGVRVLEPSDIAGLSSPVLTTLLMDENDDWSAVTVGESGRAILIRNPSHSTGRTSSDIMHELSHLLIGHEPSRIVFSEDMFIALRSYDQLQEDEASWLSGSLLLPRPALLSIAQSGIDDAQACRTYDVSGQLLGYRRNVTGVARQMQYGSRRRTQAGVRAR